MRTHKNSSDSNATYSTFAAFAGALVLAFAGSMLMGCGDDKQSCNVEQYNGRPQMVCRDDDGDIQGNPVPVEQGACLVDYITQDGVNIVYHCSDGREITSDGGSDGLPGAPGANGSDGSDGQGCVVVENGDTCTITCSNSSTTFWCGDTPPNNPPGCTPTAEVCNGYDDDCDGQVDEGNVCGSTTPTTGWKLCRLTPLPSQAQAFDQNFYVSAANAYRNNTGNMECWSLGSSAYTEDYGSDNTAAVWLVANTTSGQCTGTVVIEASPSYRIVGGAASGFGAEGFDLTGFAQVGFTDPGGCAVAFLTTRRVSVRVQ